MGLALLNKDHATQVKTIIVGLGKTGLACARFLISRGEEVMVVDSRQAPPGLEVLQREFPHVPVQLGKFDGEMFSEAELLVVSPGVPLEQPAIVEAMHRGVRIIGDIELFAQHAKAPVVAITGSNGKSTVTTLLYQMARAANRDVRVGGNLGTPALELIQETEPDLYVLELSSFQLEATHSLKPAAAAVLNVSQDHLDRYGDMLAYAEAKRRIFHGAGIRLVNRDDPVVGTWCQSSDNCCRRFSLSEPVSQTDYGLRQAEGKIWLVRGDELFISVDELKVAGMHNVANALAAIALGEAIGLPKEMMLKALCEFRGLPHRCQWLAEENGVTWYNDSKATNVGAAVAAITGMKNKVVLIAGGEGKGQDFSPLRAALVAKGRAAILIGRDASLIKAALGDEVPVSFAANLGEAASMARDIAQAGDAVLLAPACASFDMFSGYEDRGEQFVAAVERVLR